MKCPFGGTADFHGQKIVGFKECKFQEKKNISHLKNTPCRNTIPLSALCRLFVSPRDAIEALQATKTDASLPWGSSGHEGFAEGRTVGSLGALHRDTAMQPVDFFLEDTGISQEVRKLLVNGL